MIVRAVGVAGVTAACVVLPISTAGAATAPKPSANCKVPVFSVSPLKAKPGSQVTVSGVNFSGCTAQGSKAKPTPVLTVKIGVETADKTGAVLATTKTSATGTFSAQVTLPALPSGGVAKIGLAAAATDPATGLTYAGVAVLAYDTSSTAPGGGVPTAVPAGTGGQKAAATGSDRTDQLGLLGGGVLIAGLGAYGLRRRRETRQH